MVGDLERIRYNAIKRILEQNIGCGLLDFLGRLQEHSKVLSTAPNRKNWPLNLAFAIFIIVCIGGIASPNFYDASAPNTQLIVKSYIALYSGCATIMFFFLLYEFKYYDKFRAVERRFPVPAQFDILELQRYRILDERNQK